MLWVWQRLIEAIVLLRWALLTRFLVKITLACNNFTALLSSGGQHGYQPITYHGYAVEEDFVNSTSMMTSSNGNIFCVTGHLYVEFTGHRLIPLTKLVTRSFDNFFDLRLNKRLSKQSWSWWFETPSCPLWRHCNVYMKSAICKSKVPVVFSVTTSP